MKAHEERVVAELEDLRTKCDKLRDFVWENNAVYDSLPDEDQKLLREQWRAMTVYISISARRIARFDCEKS
jgi:hypothetical protein